MKTIINTILLTLFLSPSAWSQCLQKQNALYAVGNGQLLQKIKEGFSTTTPVLDKPASEMGRAWQATVCLKGGNSKGSGTVIGIDKISETQSKVYILTANHVLENELHPVNSPDSFDILSSAKVDLKTSNYMTSNPSDNHPLARAFKIESQDRTKDLAVISIVAPTSSLQNVHKVHAAQCNLKQNDTIVAMGCPGTTLRPESAQHVMIADPNIWTKRWSSGTYTNQSKIVDGVLVELSSADSLPGFSGGTVVNDQGLLVGIIDAGNTDNSYQGAQTLGFISCSDTMAFISDFQQAHKPVAQPLSQQI